MTKNKQKNTTGGSFEIPERRSDGVSGPCRTVPGDVSGSINDCNVNNQQQDVETIMKVSQRIERNVSAPVVDTGQENKQQRDVETKDTPPRLVERATALRELSICSARHSKSTYRKQTEQDLKSPDAEVTYIKTEHAIRDLVCSLMERQDRMNEKIFLILNDLEYRVDDLKQSKKSRVTKQPDIETEIRK